MLNISSKKVLALFISTLLIIPTTSTNALEEINTKRQSRSEIATYDDSTIVDIEDASLLEAIKENLGILSDSNITVAKMNELTILNASNKGIKSIKGLEYANNLNDIDLSGNSIENIDALEDGSYGYDSINLANNKISDLTPLIGKNIYNLNLSSNKINDESMKSFAVDEDMNGGIDSSDINLANNKISDITALAGNNIRDLNLSGNLLTDASLEKFEAAGSRGMYTKKVDFSNNQLTKINANLFGRLTELNLDDNQIKDVNVKLKYEDGSGEKEASLLEAYSYLKKLSLNRNQVSDLSPIADLSHDHTHPDLEIYAEDQQIKLDKKEIDKTLKLDNTVIFRTVDDTKLNIEPDNDGKVDGNNKDYSILWDNLKGQTELGFTFEGEYSKNYTPAEVTPDNITLSSGIFIKFSGKVLQPINITGSGGSGGNPDPGDPQPPAPSDTKTVILASGEKYTDVLTATVLGNEKDAPILLATKDNIDEKTLAEIKRLSPDEIIISGGEASVSQKVVDKLSDYKVTRISGSDRYETAIKIGAEVRALTGNKTDAMLVDGTNFPDVITLSTLASQKSAPILLTDSKSFTKTTQDTIKAWKVDDITIGGSYNSVSKEIENALGVSKVSRFGGSDRYQTAKLIADEVRSLSGSSKTDLVLVDGTNFPDGLTINSIASNIKAPIMLTAPKSLPQVTADSINAWSIKNLVIGGGYNSVSKEVEDSINANSKERLAGSDRYETAVKISQKLSTLSK